jgi:serine/threonine protein kinase
MLSLFKYIFRAGSDNILAALTKKSQTYGEQPPAPETGKPSPALEGETPPTLEGEVSPVLEEGEIPQTAGSQLSRNEIILAADIQKDAPLRHKKVEGCGCSGCVAHFTPSGLPCNAQGLTYDNWCKHYDKNQLATENMYGYLRDIKLYSSLDDPMWYPGLQHAVSLLSDGYAKVSKESYECEYEFSRKVDFALSKIYADQEIGNQFDVGQTVNDHWKVVGNLASAEGFFNRGVHLVEDVTGRCKDTCVMKILPSDLMYEGYAHQEIAILNELEHPGHPNIVELKDAREPYHMHRNAPAWIVMNLCNAGTLKACVAKNLSRDRCAPELFVWHVFESLLEAIKYCHMGPLDLDPDMWDPAEWDPVYHRDIIPGNILLSNDDTTNENDNTTNKPYPTVVLADFGCAVQQSDVDDYNLTEHNMPEVDPRAIPPEGAQATEAVDVYQVGLVIEHLMRNHLWYAGDVSAWLRYTYELRNFVYCCIEISPAERPRATELLRHLQERKAELLASGVLKYEPLVL